MQNIIELKLVTPRGEKSLQVFWVEVEGPNGSFMVGPGHEPLISIVKKKSKISYKTVQGDFVAVDTLGGTFTVAQNKATALLDQ